MIFTSPVEKGLPSILRNKKFSEDIIDSSSHVSDAKREYIQGRVNAHLLGRQASREIAARRNPMKGAEKWESLADREAKLINPEHVDYKRWKNGIKSHRLYHSLLTPEQTRQNATASHLINVARSKKRNLPNIKVAQQHELEDAKREALSEQMRQTHRRNVAAIGAKADKRRKKEGLIVGGTIGALGTGAGVYAYKKRQRSGVSKSFVENNISKGTNINEYPHLPENIREWTARGDIIQRNPVNPLEMLSSGMLMAQASAAGIGINLTKKQKRKAGRHVANYAEGRMFMYSPVGRGTMMT